MVYLFWQKLFGYLKTKFRAITVLVGSKIWILLNTLLLVRTLVRIKKATKVKESFFLFSYKIFKLQFKLNKLSFRTQLNKNIKYINKDNFEKLKTLGRPILVVFPNHPTYLIHDHLLDNHPDFVGVSSHDFERTNMLLVTNNDKFLTYKIYQLLKNNKFVATSFDGGFGSRAIKTKFLECDIYLAKTYPALVKMINPIVVPFFIRVNESGYVEYVYGDQLFTDQEMTILSEQAILKKTIDCFTDELINNDPHQINIKWFIERLKLGQGANQPNR